MNVQPRVTSSSPAAERSRTQEDHREGKGGDDGLEAAPTAPHR